MTKAVDQSIIVDFLSKKDEEKIGIFEEKVKILLSFSKKSFNFSNIFMS